MIKTIEIENFKGVSDRVAIELRPITLLFGANSAGKSTLFHALLLASELFVRGNRNPDQTAQGGALIDLGGFPRFVNNHDLSSSVKLRFTLDVGDVAFNELWPLPQTMRVINETRLDVSTIGDDIFVVVVEVELSWDRHRNTSFVSRYSVELDGEPFATIKDSRSVDDPEPKSSLKVSRSHPIWQFGGLFDNLTSGFATLADSIFARASSYSARDLEMLVDECGDLRELTDDLDDHDWERGEDFVSGTESAEYYDANSDVDGWEDYQQENFEPSPTWSGSVITCPGFREILQRDDISIRTLEFSGWRVFLCRTDAGEYSCVAGQSHDDEAAFDDEESWCRENGISWGPPVHVDFDTRMVHVDSEIRADALPRFERALEVELLPSSFLEENEVSSTDTHFLRGLLSRLILVPGQILAELLHDMRYIGPLREIPSRNHVAPRFPDQGRWACGLGAWDILQAGDDKLIEEVGDWLGDKDKLDSGCRVQRETSLRLDCNGGLLSGRALNDLRVGDRFSTQDVPIEQRLVVKYESGAALHPHEVGVGISQLVPVIVAALDATGSLLAIEQPELHVHPRLQAAMGDLLIKAAKSKHRFIIETHSEHLILRLLRRIRETEVNKAPTERTLRTDELAIYYLKHEDGSSRALEIEVDVKGEFIQPWPDDFFELDFYERFKTGGEG